MCLQRIAGATDRTHELEVFGDIPDAQLYWLIACSMIAGALLA
jgi:hypothetical protein